MKEIKFDAKDGAILGFITGIMVTAVFIVIAIVVQASTYIEMVCDNGHYEKHEVYDLREHYNWTCGQIGFMISQHHVFTGDLIRKDQDLVYSCFGGLYELRRPLDGYWTTKDVYNYYSMYCGEDMCSLTFSGQLTPEMETKWIKECIR